MTRDDFIKRFGSIKVKFDRYYKHTFTYKTELPSGNTLSVAVGGDADEIYRFEVCAGYEETVASLEPFSGGVYMNGKEIEGFYDY